MIVSTNRDGKLGWPLALLVVLFPILPDYFGIGPVQMLYIVPLFCFFLLVSGEKNIKFNFVFLVYNIPFLLLCGIPFLIHVQIKTFVTWFVTTILVLFVIDKTINDLRQIEKSIDYILKMSIVICFFGIVERFTEFNIWSFFETASNISNDSTPYYRFDVIRIESSFGVALTFAVYLVFINILSVYKLACTKKGRVCYLLSYILSIVCIVFAQSRLPLITVVLVQMAFVLKSKINVKIKIIMGFFLGTVITLLAFGDVILEQFSQYVSLLEDLFLNSSKGKISDMTTAYRVELFGVLLPYVKEKPLWGYGAPYMVEEFTFNVLNHVHKSIDNNYLAQAMYYGIVGLLGNMYYMIVVLMIVLKKIIFSRKLDWMEYSIFILVVVYLINLASLYQMTEAHLFYIVVGLYMKYNTLKKRKIDA